MRARSVLLTSALLTLSLAGCLGNGSIVVVAQAPRLANGMSIAVAVPRGLLGAADGTADFFISHNGQVLYPPGGAVGAPITLTEGKGSAFVPYAYFVVDNGDYEVLVDYEGKRTVTRVVVEKWVHWIYALPYVKDGHFIVDVVLERSPGQPNDRVFAAGQMNLEVRYHGQDRRDDQFAFSRAVTSDGSEDFLRVSLPLTSFNSQRGYYSAEATFANFQAYNNNAVPMDPTLNDYNPPTNWVFLEGRS